MRQDMAKVVTERPRSGSGYNNHRKNDVTATRLRLRAATLAKVVDEDFDEYVDPDDGYVSHVPPWTPAQRGAFTENHVQRTPYDTKSFSDVLGPLRGYLRKQVGRRWDDVFSELSKHLDRRGTSGSHIWDHVMSEVSTNTWLGVSGTIYGNTRRWAATSPVTGLYVHPRTGVLCYADDAQRRRYNPSGHVLERRLIAFGLWEQKPYVRGDRELPRAATWKIVDDLRVLERRNGVWLVHEFGRLDPDEVLRVTLIGEREIPVRRKDVKEAKLIRHLTTRQLGRREKTLWALTLKG